MKPTSIFTTQEHYMSYHNAASKKKGLQHTNNFLTSISRRSIKEDSSPEKGDLLEEEEAEDYQPHPTHSASTRQAKLQFFEREDKNHALSQILSRECSYQDTLSTQTKNIGEVFP